MSLIKSLQTRVTTRVEFFQVLIKSSRVESVAKVESSRVETVAYSHESVESSQVQDFNELSRNLTLIRTKRIQRFPYFNATQISYVSDVKH